jgi:MFS family permease
MAFNWKRAVSIGFGFVAIFLIWPIYNQFIPVFLQAGNPLWEAESTVANPALTEVAGFGLSSTLAFFIMTWDNIINIFVQSWAGAKSDRTWTRWGRRKPWLVVGVPIAALGFILIPTARTLITILLFILITNLGMALFRAPTAAYLGDQFLPQQRSKARGIAAMMAGLGGILALIVGSLLFERIGRSAPFIFSAVLMIAATLMVLLLVRELPAGESETAESRSTVRQAFQFLWQAENHSGIWLLVTVSLSFMIFESLQAGLSSFAVFVLDIPLGQAVRLAAVFALVLVLSAYPSGMIGTRFGRQRTINAGLVGLLLTTVCCYFFIRSPLSFVIILIPLGLFTSFVVINDLPLLYDISDGGRIGAFTGVYFVATQTAAVLGPTLAGFATDIAGSHRAIFAFAALCALIAWVLLQRVRIVRPELEPVAGF